MTKLYAVFFNVIALSAVIYTGVDIFYKVLGFQLSQTSTPEIVLEKPVDVTGDNRGSLDDYDAIIERNLFGSVNKASAATGTEEIEALEPTSLEIALLGTVTGNDKVAFAVIEETGKRKQGLYRVGDSVQEASVKRILRGKVVLRVGDKDQILTMEESRASRTQREGSIPGPAKRGSTIIVRRSEIRKAMGNINKLLSQVRVRPHFRGGRPEGLSLSRIQRGSIFDKLGLKNGDIVQGINGRPIKGPDDLMALYRKLRLGSHLSLQVTQGGRRKTINYRFR